MLGNDIVDLEQAHRDSKWERNGYLEKIFTLTEQELILNAEKPSAMLWLLWSMKEAAYKAENRMTNERFYAPKRFSCIQLAIDGTFNVKYRDHLFYISSVINVKYIHSIAMLDLSELQRVHIHYQQNQPDYVREFSGLYPGYSLKKDKAGLPAIINHQTGLKHAASVSHHGQYLAIIYSDSLLLKD